jgi:hypothetical protein
MRVERKRAVHRDNAANCCIQSDLMAVAQGLNSLGNRLLKCSRRGT